MTAHGATPYERKAGGLGQAEGEVGALDRRSAGALGEVVDGGDDDQPAGVGVDGDLQRDGVGAEHCAVVGHWPSGSRCTNGSSA